MNHKNLFKKGLETILVSVLIITAKELPAKPADNVYLVVVGGYNIGTTVSADKAMMAPAFEFYQMLKTQNIDDTKIKFFVETKNWSTVTPYVDASWTGDDNWTGKDMKIYPTAYTADDEDSNVTTPRILEEIANIPSTKNDNIIISLNTHGGGSSQPGDGYSFAARGGTGLIRGLETWNGFYLDGGNIRHYMLNEALKSKEYNVCIVVYDACNADALIKDLDKTDADENRLTGLQASPLKRTIGVASSEADSVQSGMHITHYLAHIIKNNPAITIKNALELADSLTSYNKMVVRYFDPDTTALKQYTATHSFFEVDEVGINDKLTTSKNKNLKITNPIKDELIIYYPGKTNIEMYSIDGKLVNKVDHFNQTKIITKDVKPGLYFLKINNEERRIIKY